MANLHGIGFVHEIWDERRIQQHYAETGGKNKVRKGETWYRVVFEEEYHDDPDEYDENGELLSCGSDNAITFLEDEIIEVNNG